MGEAYLGIPVTVPAPQPTGGWLWVAGHPPCLPGSGTGTAGACPGYPRVTRDFFTSPINMLCSEKETW